ncbi:MAG: MFS transporter [Kiloniellales bacterium]|nr:MFS transporter [Kiloniellales bacterium]
MPIFLVLSGATIMALTFGLRQSFGLYLPPISLELDAGRETFALGMGLMNLFWGLGSPIAGAVADRYGAGRVTVLGGLCYAGGIAMMSLEGSGEQLIAAGVLIGAGLSGAGLTVVLGAVGRGVAPERRSTALAIASVGGSIGQFISLPYVHLLITGFGWSDSLIVLAATALLILPLAYGLRGGGGATSKPDLALGAALREARAHSGFWFLTIGFFVCGFHLAFIGVHLPAYLADWGLGASLGATALAVIGFCNILGTLGCGYLGDRYPKKTVLAVLYLLRSLVIAAFLAVPISEQSVILFAGAMGFLWLGTVPLTSGIVSVVFGPTYMSTLFGIVFLSHQVGGFLGAWLAGYLFDATQSYDVMWILSIALGLATAVLHLPIQEKPIERARVAASATA